MAQQSFRCLSVTPIGLEHAGLAIATARAGGVGILDCEFHDNGSHLQSMLDTLLASVAEHQQIGLRIRTAQIFSLEKILAQLRERQHWLILCGDNAESIAAACAALPACELRQVLVEVTNAEIAAGLVGMPVQGIVARGHEAGGWSGEDSTFILTQKLLESAEYPVYVQGGIGLHTAAACRAAGAAGVVLDDQLLLMAESPLPDSWRRHLETLNGQEAIVVGEQIACPCRVLTRPGFKVIPVLKQLATTAELEGWSSADWRGQVNAHIGWKEPGELAWPVGQAIGLAAAMRDRYKTTGRLIRALLDKTLQIVASAQTLKPLAPGSALAESHGTRYPVVQGPMTRVSDKAEFADAVAQAGGLPMLALALMRGEQVRELLTKAKQLLGDRPWGVGILGFVPEQLREEQIRVINDIKPPFALIAGGRPDQAARFEATGIATYIHAPAPQLLKMFLEQGARRFVFEGRECGGHVGPLSSFVLWEQMINVLLRDTPRGAERDVHILFAGGIHDARSAAMVATLAAPLAQRGMHVGVLVGTAYLFTKEIVGSDAVVKGFQEQALQCRQTINLETGPGHASRCSVTPFAHEFYATRRNMLAAGESADAIKDALEDLNLGRLRIASKGVVRKGDDGVSKVDDETQFREGMYMIGQVATMRDQVLSVEELHSDVSKASTALLDNLSVSTKAEKAKAAPSDIAIIGIGTLLPGAQDLQQYWSNIIAKKNLITEVPEHRWDWRLYFDSDRHTRDKIYSRWGGFLDEVAFDPVRYGIPPNSLKSIDPMQLLALEAVRRALEDSGYADGDFDRENTSVIIGAGGGLGDLGQQYAIRSEIPHFVETPSDEVWDRLPEWTEESFPGTLLNVISGRIANRFDFGGSNFTVDAACASSLAAVKLAVDELESGRSNVVIAGGVDTVQNPFGYLCFSKTQALSPKGVARTFDKNGDGIVISEGTAMIVMKRLADAERDGDRIYAVIKAVSSSSDGKALGLTAPLPEGQMRALYRAYDKAGYGPETLGLIEAHGTGTVVGDNAEAQTVTRTLRACEMPAKSCVIGSVKTMIGHTKATAGVAGLVKVVLALHHKVLPPHMGVESPIEPIADSTSPVYLLKDARPWVAHPDHPRRGGVSAFGFGGTNFHATLEEYKNEYRGTAAPSGADHWPFELLLFRNSSRPALAEDLLALQKALRAGAQPALQDLAYSCALRFQVTAATGVAVALVVDSLKQLGESLDLLIPQLQGGARQPLPPFVICEDVIEADARGKLAFLFPGQGAQYPDMARETALYVPELRNAVEFADRWLHDRYPRRLSDFIYPPSAYSSAETDGQYQRITNTHVAQPSIGAIASGYIDLARRLGLGADMAAGHSYGEFAALYAAGVMSRETFLTLSETRGRVMAGANSAGDAGTMAAVQMPRDKLTARLKTYPDIVVANHNAPLQSVISGPTALVEQAVKDFAASDITARLLPVSGAFHSSLMAGAQKPFAEAIGNAEFIGPALLPVYGNSTAAPYESDVAAIRKQLCGHLMSPVEFVGQITAMYEAGARTFVELGPKSILSNLVGQILEGREHVAVALDGQGGGLQKLLIALGRLAARGTGFDIAALFQGRNVQALEMARLETTKPAPMSPTTWLLNGGCARRQNEPKGRTGKLPALTEETSRQAKQALAAKLSAAANSSIQIRPQQPNFQPQSHSQPMFQSQPQPAVVAQSISTSGTPIAAPVATHFVAPAPVQHAPAVVPAVNSSAMVEALASYQETMRQFLSVQEQVVRQFLGSTQSTGAQPHVSQHYVSQQSPVQQQGSHAPSFAPMRAPEPVRPVVAPAPVVLMQAQATPVQVTPNVAAVMPAPAQMAQPVAVVAAAGLNRAELTGLLQELVSERTGYPIEMLGLNQDLEAELGIDSIKRVEIVGALQKRLPPSLTERMQAKMEQLTRSKTLNGLLDQMLDGVAMAAAAAPSQPAGPVALAVAGPNREELTSLLQGLVSERTGYPIEMLGLNQDLEAELGIDSIKRVEIVGALQKRLPASMTERMQAKMEQLTRSKTLSGLLDQLLDGVAMTAAAAPSQPAVAEALAAAGPNREELTGLLQGLVSERTGYPIEMLGLNQDLEAELGIDSIKRVEIVGALQKRLPASMTERMQAKMEQLTRSKTLSGLLDQLLDGVAVAAPVSAYQSSAPQSQPIAAVAAAGPNRAELTTMLQGLVSERTGYPIEMLGLNQDLEAELGIDSIKRVEIVGALQKRLPASMTERMQAKMEQLTRSKTLNGLLDQLLEKAAGSVARIGSGTTESVTVAAPAQRPATSSESAPRFVIEGRAEPLPAPSESVKGLFLVTADGLGVTPLLIAALKKLGATPVVIEPDVLLEAEALGERISALRQKHGPVAGVLHLVALSEHAAPASLAEWQHYTRLHTKSFFRLMKLCSGDLQQVGKGRVLVTSLLGGSYGRNGESAGGLVTAGGCAGLLKTILQECVGVTGKMVDFDRCLSSADIAGVIVNELLASTDSVEVGYPGGERTVFYTAPAPLHTLSAVPQLLPGEGWVTLVTAGARGITAEIAIDFARPGMKVVIVGRTPAPQPEPAETAGISEVAGLRRYLLQQAQSSGKALTPVMIEEQLSKLLGEREIRRNLAHLVAAGAEVIYRSVDVKNEAEFGGLIDGIYDQYGRLDAVLHGAGVIEDKLIADKTDASFDRVFDTKADSGFLLSKHLRPETLKVVLFFTSVAGRYGNPGQGDYAAANEVVNRLAWQLDQQWKDTRVMAINWGPWDTTGMASEGVKRKFRERGIIPIPVDAGRFFFINELRFGHKGEVELVAGAGPWERDLEQAPVVSAPYNSAFPLLLSQPKMEPNGTMRMEHRFTLANDPYLGDHRLDNKPVLPVAGAAEWIAQFVQAAFSEWVVSEVRDLTVMRGLKFNADDALRVVFSSRASSHADAESLQVAVEIADAETRLPYYKASVILRPQLEDAPVVDMAALGAGQAVDVDAAYREFLFHGPCFQLIDTIPALNGNGLDATVHASEPAAWLEGRGATRTSAWMFDPGILDAAPQLAIVWSRLQRGTTALPSRFGSVTRYKPGTLQGPLRLLLRITPNDNDHLLMYDAVVVDAEGRVRIRMLDIESACNAALNRLAVNP